MLVALLGRLRVVCPVLVMPLVARTVVAKGYLLEDLVAEGLRNADLLQIVVVQLQGLGNSSDTVLLEHFEELDASWTA